jgi:hypothetical protein
LNSPSHSAQHANVNDAVEALQAKVGVDGSAVTTSIDYQLNTGYRYHSTVYFTSSGTFTKASYPWLRAMKVTVVGGGGGGGGVAATGTGQSAEAGGGAGGGYAIKFITDIAGLSASETVTVGAGGSGGAAGANNGTDGGTTSAFGLTGGLGLGGDGMIAIGSGRTAFGRDSNIGTGGDINGRGDFGGSGVVINAGVAVSQTNNGGGTILTGTRNNAFSNIPGTPADANTGGGGSGARNRQQNATAKSGGDGAAGIVIVELYA